MINTNNSFLVAKYHLLDMIKGKALWIIFTIGFLLLIGSEWDIDSQKLKVLGLTIDGFGIGQTQSDIMLAHFYDVISTIWLFIIITFGFQKVLLPMSKSFSVSQTLWLRLTPISSVELAISRIIVILSGTILITILSSILAMLYWLMHGNQATQLFLPIIGFTGHLLISGGLIVSCNPGLTTSLSFRTMLAVLFAGLPMLSYILFHNIADNLNGFFPYTAPFIFKDIGMIALKPFLMTGLVGSILLILHPVSISLKNLFSTSKN